MAKGKLILTLCLALVILSLVGVKAEFSYKESYNNPVNNYDTWVYKIDIDDEDTKITLNHFWSSPSYESEYETKSRFAFDVTPPTPRLEGNLFNLNQPSSQSFNIGQSLVNSFNKGYSPYTYTRNYFGVYGSIGYGGYTPNSWW
jgi:hypothetical protein